VLDSNRMYHRTGTSERNSVRVLLEDVVEDKFVDADTAGSTLLIRRRPDEPPVRDTVRSTYGGTSMKNSRTDAAVLPETDTWPVRLT